MTKTFVKSVTDLAAMVPRIDGGVGVGERWCHNIIKRASIVKGENGYDVEEFLNAARAVVSDKKTASGSLDDEIKHRKIQLLDIEIKKAIGQYVDGDEIADKIIQRDGQMMERAKVWRDTWTAKRPELREAIETAHRELCTLLAEEPI